MKTFVRILFVCVMIFRVSLYANFEPVKTGVQFVGGDDAANEILGGPLAPCVARVPTWVISAYGGDAGSNFSALAALADCRESLTDALRDFTDVEKNMLTEYVVLMDSIIDADFPALNSFPWSFAAISDSADFGAPQSRDHIILAQGLLAEMNEWIETQSRQRFVAMEILIREKTRLLQERHPERFETFYIDVWNFRRVNEFALTMEQMQSGEIFMPSVPQNVWLINAAPRNRREFIMPALLLRGAGTENIASAPQRAAIVFDSTAAGFVPRASRRALFEHRDLRQIAQYRRMFTRADYDHHPAELAADLLAKYLVMKYVSAGYGTAPARGADYSHIDMLIKLFE